MDSRKFSLSSFHREYQTDITDIVVCGRKFQFYLPRSLDPFIDPDDLFHEFPLWSKIWEAAWVLADCLARTPPDPERRILEIGSGVGVAGIVGASFGHRVTLTEINPDALNFSRANALLNHCDTVAVELLDWNHPDLQRKFDMIVGSELAYKDASFRPLGRLFESTLKPGGEIIIAAGVRETSIAFFKQMQEYFNMTTRKMVLRSADAEIHVLLCRMTPKS